MKISQTITAIFIITLFSCGNEPQNEQLNMNEKTSTETLAYAISDVGLWTWFTSDGNKTVQLEFDRTMLFIDNPENKETPSNKIALRFINTKSVTLFYKEESQLPQNWLKLFEKDELEPFSIDYEYFSFEKEDIEEMIVSAARTETIIGEKYSDEGLSRLGFWAGDVGIAVVADSMKIVSHSGKIELEDIPNLHKKWWEYWQKYWELKDTETPMPYDPLCEITIPATKANAEKIKNNLDK